MCFECLVLCQIYFYAFQSSVKFTLTCFKCGLVLYQIYSYPFLTLIRVGFLGVSFGVGGEVKLPPQSKTRQDYARNLKLVHKYTHTQFQKIYVLILVFSAKSLADVSNFLAKISIFVKNSSSMRARFEIYFCFHFCNIKGYC